MVLHINIFQSLVSCPEHRITRKIKKQGKKVPKSGDRKILELKIESTAMVSMAFRNDKFKNKLVAVRTDACQLLESYSMFSSALNYTEIDLKGKISYKSC